MYTFDIAARAYLYTKTTEAIANWVMRNLKFPIDIWSSVKMLVSPEKAEWRLKSTKPKEGEDKDMNEKILPDEIKKYMLRVRKYKDNKGNVFTVVMGQCNELLKAKLAGQDDWDRIFTNNDLVELMKSIEL